MFMGNDEIKNTMALTRIKFKATKTYMLRVILFISLAFLAVMIPSLVSILKYKAMVSDIKIYDYSYFLFLGLIGAVITSCSRYKQINDYYNIFPQTGTSRFLSTQLILYLWLALISVFAFAIYMIQFVIIKLLSKLNSNIILAFRTDIGLILTGIFIYFLYGLLMISFFSLMATLIRKFNEIAIGILMVFAAILVTSEEGLFHAIPKLLSFLIEEPKISIFLLKGMVVWLLLFIAALLVNHYTLYHKTQRKYKNSIVTAVGVAALILISIIRASLPDGEETFIKHNVYYNGSFSDDKFNLWQDKTIVLDASEHEGLSQIPIESNFGLSDDMYMAPDKHIFGFGNSIEIRYRLPVRIMNDYNLTELTNPEFTAKLEDDKLVLNYNYIKNTKVIFISPWFVMKQFEKYQNKNLFFKAPDFYHSSSNGNGHVEISER